MNKDIIEIFKELSQIPRCSKNHKPFIEYISKIAKETGYKVLKDKTKNILLSKGEPKVCLQAHYDMVCIGGADGIEVYEEDGFIKAKHHTLGADNGIAIAYMIALMRLGYEFEALLTSDEEIGLIGANGLDVDVKSKYILNIDTEEEDYIYIGCAGGVNIDGFIDFEYEEIQDDEYLYELNMQGFSGGHSGVDIDKNIDNAIVLLIESIKNLNVDLVSINGGQADNAIPVSANAIICSKDELPFNKIKRAKHKKIKDSKKVIEFLSTIKTGVISKDEDMVQTSKNFAIINTNEKEISFIVSLRAMSNEKLTGIKTDLKDKIHDNGYRCIHHSKYPAWKPSVNDFTKYVKDIYSKYSQSVDYKTIHAGLECGVLLDKYPDKLVASIGPNIYFPHSINEKSEIRSINKLFEVTKDIVENIDKI
jgi:dipeptidase D